MTEKDLVKICFYERIKSSIKIKKKGEMNDEKNYFCYIISCTYLCNSDVCRSRKSGEKETIVITSLNGEKQEQNLEVPYDPERIAILDMASMDILANLGVGDRIIGSASTSLEYLQEYVENVDNLGTIKEADLEAVMECDPDIIFIGGRLASSYDALSEIAPVVYLSTDTEIGVVESVRKNAETIASIFGREDQVAEKMEGFEERIAEFKFKVRGKNSNYWNVYKRQFQRTWK